MNDKYIFKSINTNKEKKSFKEFLRHQTNSEYGGYKIYDGMIIKARIENLLDDQYEEVFGFQSQGLGIYLGIGSEF